MKKILLTGGHAATPALATVEEILKQKKDWELIWIGPSSAMEGQKVVTAAEKILKARGVSIERIVAGRLKKRGSLVERLSAYVKIPIGLLHAFALITKYSPDAVVSFGGFAAFPVVFAAWIFGKPVLLQEQIVGAGLANRLSIPFATKIAVAREESLEFFPREKTVHTGNPQVSEIVSITKKKKIGNPPTLYITGGSSGSQNINEAVDSVLEKFLATYVVIHQTGDANIAYFQHRKENLPRELARRYECFGYMSPGEIAHIFKKADIVVSRAGANTVADIVLSRRPAVLIPIPWSIGDEQLKNAQKAQRAGIAVILSQENLTGEKIFEAVEKIRVNWPAIVRNAATGDFEKDRNAAGRVVELINQLL